MIDWVIATTTFATGMAAFFSPCGFPMLPAFIAYYLNQQAGSEGGAGAVPERSVLRRALSGLGGGSVAAVGAFLVLAAIAVLAITLGAPFKERVLLLELFGGLMVLGMGVAMLLGKDLSFTPRVTAGKRKGVLGLFSFGALYAAVGAGCVAPIFINVVFQVLRAPTPAIGAVYMGAYALGFGILLVAVTVAVAIAGTALVRRMNVVLPHVKRVSGVILVVVGAYLIWYWAEIEFFIR